jgi:hypothetical protein
MKKWLIFAVIAALFAVVMFPACGDKGAGDNGGAASGVTVTKMYSVPDPTKAPGTLAAYNITWEGVPGYDYFVYYEVKDPDGTVQYVDTTNWLPVKGQTLFAFQEKKDPADTTGATLANPYFEPIDAADQNAWSILVASGTAGYSGTINSAGTDHGGTAAGGLWTALGGGGSATPEKKYRIAVVAANPGGFPIEEKRTVVYSEGWFDNTVPPVAP